MAINTDLYKALRKKTGWSPAKLSRKASALANDHGPMTPDDARYIIAHEHGINLRKHGLTTAEVDRVRVLRSSGATLDPARGRRAERVVAVEERTDTPEIRPPTPSALFDSRAFHPQVVKSSKKRFVNGHRSDAIRASFQALNNRVRKASGIPTSTKDGEALMLAAFSPDSPALQMTKFKKGTSEEDEQRGTRFMATGAMQAMRNPRSHDDQEWWTDGDVDFVLEALALASLLHRYLDHCEAYAQT